MVTTQQLVPPDHRANRGGAKGFGGGVIRERGVPDELDVPGERLEVPLHPVDTHGDGSDQAEAVRVLGEDRPEVATERHVVADENPVADTHRKAHTLVVGVADADREPDIGDAEC